MTIIRLKRGADFRHRIPLPELAEGYDTLASQARRGAVVTDLDVRPLDNARAAEIHATAAQTATWPLGLMPCDLRMIVAGEAAHTETIHIHVLPGVTQND